MKASGSIRDPKKKFLKIRPNLKKENFLLFFSIFFLRFRVRTHRGCSALLRLLKILEKPLKIGLGPTASGLRPASPPSSSERDLESEVVAYFSRFGPRVQVQRRAVPTAQFSLYFAAPTSTPTARLELFCLRYVIVDGGRDNAYSGSGGARGVQVRAVE